MNMNSVNRIILFFSIVILCTSCSSFSWKTFALWKNPALNDFKAKNYREMTPNDYVDHLSGLADAYLRTPDVRIISLSSASRTYLEKLSQQLIANNELLFDKKITPTFYVIDSKTPWYFSLPEGKIFFSLGLIQKHFRYEGALLSVLSFELVKSLRNVYPEVVIIPTGQILTERLINLTRVSLDEKMEVNKWAYYAMKRAGFDQSSYLSWIQTLNRNTLDFALLTGDAKKTAREESLFKSFVISRKDKIAKNIVHNSSTEFYEFIKEMRRVVGKTGA